MKNKEYYQQLFQSYPDVVTIDQFMKMLGGIGDGTARKLLQDNHVKYFLIRHKYFIPKEWIIEYVLSEHYSCFKKKLKTQI